MKKLVFIAFLIYGFYGCTPDNIATVVDIIESKPTYLRVVNELEEDFYSINAVELGHYTFKKLNISHGKWRKFRLTGELPLEIDGMEITVTFSSETRTIIEKGIIDLYPGGTTIIWLTGREGCGGCGGHSIEWGWED